MERPKIETNGTNAITILEFKASTISSSEAHIQNKIVVNKFFCNYTYICHNIGCHVIAN
jgi:hypothetical protein